MYVMSLPNLTADCLFLFVFFHVICLCTCNHIKQGENKFKEDIYLIGYSEETLREIVIALGFPIMVIEIMSVETV